MLSWPRFARFQPEIEANGIEVRAPQKTDLVQLPPRAPRRSRRPPEDLSIDREAFRQWLEQQEGSLVGTGLTEVFEGFWGVTETDPPGQDDTPLARYLAGVLGHRVYIAAPGIFLPRSADQPMMRLLVWASAFDEQIQPTPHKTVTKEEALAALEQR